VVVIIVLLLLLLKPGKLSQKSYSATGCTTGVWFSVGPGTSLRHRYQIGLGTHPAMYQVDTIDVFMAWYLVKHRDNFAFEICCFLGDWVWWSFLGLSAGSADSPRKLHQTLPLPFPFRLKLYFLPDNFFYATPFPSRQLHELSCPDAPKPSHRVSQIFLLMKGNDRTPQLWNWKIVPMLN